MSIKHENIVDIIDFYEFEIVNQITEKKEYNGLIAMELCEENLWEYS